MRVTIVTLYTDNIAEMGDASAAVNKRYAEKHGYKFACYRKLLDPSRPPAWNKLLAVQRELDACDWVVWIDADAIFVNESMSCSCLLEPAKKHLLVSSDHNGLCTGFFALRNCDWSRDLLRTWLFLGEMAKEAYSVYGDKTRWEQNTLKAITADFVTVSDNVELIPQALVQNYMSEFSGSALAVHFWNNDHGPARTLNGIKALLANGAYTSACHRPED